MEDDPVSDERQDFDPGEPNHQVEGNVTGLRDEGGVRMTAHWQPLTIIHTNDLHSRFEQMPRMASAIRQLKQHRTKDEVLTLDIGDHMDRMRVETEGSMGAANVAVLNATGYDAVVLGNNEGLTFPKETIERTYRDHARFAILGSNLTETETGRQPDWMVPSVLMRRGQIQVGLIGVTAFYSAFYTLLGWTVLEPIEAVRREASRLRSEGADVVVVMSHLGLTQDRLMAHGVPEVDIILGGHTHHLLETPERVGNVWIAATGSHGKYVGELTLRYDLGTRKLELEQGRCLPVDEYPADPVLERLIERYRAAGERELQRPIAKLEEPLALHWYEESELGNLLAAGIRRWTGGEIGLVNAGQLLAEVREGTVTAGQLHQLCPSPINPCVTLLAGRHLVQALEESLLPEFYERPIKGFGFRGQVLGVLCVDGLEVHYDPSGKAMGKIRSVLVNGAPLMPDKRYRVGMIDMFTFGSGYTSLAQGEETWYYLPEFLRDLLADQLQRADQLLACRTIRWQA